MAIDLTTVFGSEINVVVQPRDVARQYSAFPGAHGITAMHLGSRGRRVRVTGRIATAGASYDAARTNCQIAIDSIEPYLWAPAADYNLGSCVFYAVVWDRFGLIERGRRRKVFSYCSPGVVVCDFVADGRALI